jgi:antitoxin component of RelBE/YafQ-DinJ toxin-antitoxin module
MKIITLKDATAVREENNSSVRFFLGDMANTKTFPLDLIMDNNETGQVHELYT